MKKCPFCGADIEENAQFCLYCMTSLVEKEQILVHKKKKPQGLLILAAIVGAAVILLLLLFSKRAMPDAESQTQDTTQTSDTTKADTVPTTQATTAPETDPTTEPTEEETKPTQAATQPTAKPSGKPDRPTEPETDPTQPATQPTTQPTEPEAEPTVPETEPGDPSHSHSFTIKKATYKFLASGADCVNPATYYYSCSCGAKGTKTFESGKARGHTVEKMPDSFGNCVNPDSTGGEYCTTCQAIITPPTLTPPVGHQYSFSYSTPSCHKCGAKGTFIIQPPYYPAVSDDEHYQINNCSYYLYREGTNYVTLTLGITNLHPSEDTFALTVSLISTGGGTMGSNPDNIVIIEPGETAYWWADVYIPSPNGTYVLYP